MTPDQWRRIERDLAELLRRQRGLRYDELERVLRPSGFEERRSTGSHRTFTHPSARFPVTVPEGRGHLKPIYVKKVVEAIQEVLDDAEENEEDGKSS